VGSKNEVNDMLPEYDFTNAVKNPYAKKLKKQITINLDCDTIDYFKEQSDQSGIPYQTLINLYLADCVLNKKKLHMTWN
jgi:predicted DNA binding CopG/RHH family protein